jgi:hypothetical protein
MNPLFKAHEVGCYRSDSAAAVALAWHGEAAAGAQADYPASVRPC